MGEGQGPEKEEEEEESFVGTAEKWWMQATSKCQPNKETGAGRKERAGKGR